VPRGMVEVKRPALEGDMQAERFDEISMVTATRSRRSALRTVAGLAMGGALGVLGREHPASARCREKWSKKRIRKYIRKAARRYNQSYKKMLCVAKCESNLTACATNPAGPWRGLFQFSDSTWKWTPYRKRDIYNPRFNALAAGWMWKKHDPADHWTCYGRGYCNYR
jgi:hypothetical protein